MFSNAHVAAVSINQTVGDWTQNYNRIVAAIGEAKKRGARLIVFPEMCVSGYSLGDRLLMDGTLHRSWQMLEEVRPHTQDAIVLLGLPLRHRDVLYNVVVVISNGRICGIVPKENLATGDVQYENRWYSGWPHTRVEEYATPSGEKIPMGGLIFQAKGFGRFAIEICEDGWKGIRPGSIYTLAGAHILANPSASWFTIGKHRTRKHMVEQISREDHCTYLYTSLMGCDATRLIFDGSLFIATDGTIEKEGRRFLFTEDFEIVDHIIDVGALERARAEEGSWRQQSEQLLNGEFGTIPPTIEIDGNFECSYAPHAPKPYWMPTEAASPDQSLQWLVEQGLIPRLEMKDLSHLELELALALGLREYTKKCGIQRIALALSGGRDSAMCALLVARMLRYDNPNLGKEDLRALARDRFVTAYMGTDNSGSATRNAARALAEEIGALHYDGAIQDAVNTHLDIMEQMSGVRLSWNRSEHDIPLQNVQARLRGSLIWMVANVHNALLISTSNKSEAAVGYTTMDGDTSGGLSPIADVPKSLIKLWLIWAARFHRYESMELVISTPSTAELRPQDQAQTDEKDLMPFFVLDQLMHQFVQFGREPVELFQVLWPSLKEHYQGNARAFADHIHKFVRKICFAQWKRERFAISFRVTAFDLDPKTGYRFPPVQSPFREELAELDAYVEQL
ncbi:MAG: NAD(+) synthase [Myxococcota bacterium]|nr:NAD(+) synthase [Myxococcota bacterium]